MPGLVGIVDRYGLLRPEHLLEARRLLRHGDWYADDALFRDANVLASRTGLGTLAMPPSPVRTDGCCCWVEGEAYGLAPDRDLASFLIQCYKSGTLAEELAQLDAYFVAALYDTARKKILLVSDRYGLKPLFMWEKAGHFAWASEAKAFLAWPPFSPRINGAAFDCFMDVGYLLGNTTWFEGVEQIPPATVVTHDIAQQTTDRRRYWKWSYIRPQSISFSDAAEHLGNLLEQAVRSRVFKGGRTCVSLSGGKDSRAILASVPDPAQTACVTFGSPGCDDYRIASMAATRRGAPHSLLELNARNWFEGRAEAVWVTDGMLDIAHMHGTPVLPRIRKLADVNLNGFLGDVVCGGSYMKGRVYNRRVDEEFAAEWYGIHRHLTNFSSDFYAMDHVDPYLICNRGRRFIAAGTTAGTAFIEQRKPFFHNGLLEFCYSLPDEYRVDARVYNKALLVKFPDLYRDIPWQGTGRPLTREPHVPREPRGVDRFDPVKRIKGFWRLRHLALGTRARCVGVIRRLVPKRRSDYASTRLWLRQPEMVSFMRSLLGPDALHRELTDRDIARDHLEPLLRNEASHVDQLCRAVTVELWLRQVHTGQYREPPEQTGSAPE